VIDAHDDDAHEPRPGEGVGGALDKQLIKQALFPRRAEPARIGRFTVLGRVGRGGNSTGPRRQRSSAACRRGTSRRWQVGALLLSSPHWRHAVRTATAWISSGSRRWGAPCEHGRAGS